MFENENTFQKMKDEGKESEFHAFYDQEIVRVKGEFGKSFPMLIGGNEVFSSEGTFEDTSPSDTRVVLGRFQKGTRADARKAIEAANNAFEVWSQTSYQERVAIFRKAAELMAGTKFKLAAEMTFENGKNRFEAVGDVDEAIDMLRYYCEVLEASQGFEKRMGQVQTGEHAKSLLKPYGVWAVIAPFNFPLAIATGMTTGATLTGNTAVLKPASDTPLMSYELCRILEASGLPPGVLNYVTGPGSTVGQELVESRGVSGVVFTGSWDVGFNSLVGFESTSPRPFIAEMGGKNATIVTKEADINDAVEGIIRGSFGFGGQKCSAGSRVYVQQEVKDKFIKTLVDRVSQIKIGDPAKKDVFLGPLVNEKAYKNFENYVSTAKKEGQIIYGGQSLTEGNLSHGYFVQPTIVVNTPESGYIIKNELFVPMLAVQGFDTLDEAISKMNDVDYGLTAGIFSKDKAEVERFFEGAKAGVLYANRKFGSTTGASVGVQPFVGWKHSGSSGKGAGGPYYLQQFLREQSQTYYD